MSVHIRSFAFLRANPRPSSTRQTRLSARPAAPNAPEALLSESPRPSTSAVIAVPFCDCAESSADVTESIVSFGRARRREVVGRVVDQRLPGRTRRARATANSSAGNSDISE